MKRQTGPTFGDTVEGSSATEVEMLTPVSSGWGSEVVHSEVTTKVGFNKWFGVVGLMAALVVVWSLVSGSKPTPAVADHPQSEVASLEGAAGDPDLDLAEEDIEGETPRETAPAVEEVSDTTSVRAAAPDSSESGTPAQDKIDLLSAEAQPDLVLLTEDGEPASTVLSEPIGYAVLVSGERLFELVDLDGGRSVEIEGVGGEVVLVTGSHIVFRSDSGSGSLRASALNSLGSDSVRLNGGLGYPHVSAGPEADQVWLLDRDVGSGESISRTLLDLSTGEPLLSYPVDPSFMPMRDGPSDIGNVLGGGVFAEATDGRLQRLADGWALLASDDLVLVQTCSDRLPCSIGWVDRGTGKSLDYPVPDVHAKSWWASAVGTAGRWFWWAELGQFGMMEIESGRTIEIPDVDPWTGLDISPDARWATYLDHRRSQLNVINLETGEVFHYTHNFSGHQATFVPLESLNQ